MVAELAVEVVGGEAVLEAVPPHFPRGGGVELGAVVDVGVQDGVEDLAASGDSVVREVGEGPEAGAVDAVGGGPAPVHRWDRHEETTDPGCLSHPCEAAKAESSQGCLEGEADTSQGRLVVPLGPELEAVQPCDACQKGVDEFLVPHKVGHDESGGVCLGGVVEEGQGRVPDEPSCR